MNPSLVGRVVCALIFVSAAAPSPATIIDTADIGGFRTFQDLNTGRTWLDQDNFSNQSFADMAAFAAAQGFTVAGRSDVAQLVGSLPLDSAQWTDYASIMGASPFRGGTSGLIGIIWAGYSEPSGLGPSGMHGWAWSYETDTQWNFLDNQNVNNFVENSSPGNPPRDMNIWAYKEATASVPDPTSTVALLGISLSSLVWLHRKRAGDFAG